MVHLDVNPDVEIEIERESHGHRHRNVKCHLNSGFEASHDPRHRHQSNREASEIQTGKPPDSCVNQPEHPIKIVAIRAAAPILTSQLLKSDRDGFRFAVIG
jgi:hypothetical protein